MNQQKLAVSSGAWPVYRFDPRRTRNGEAPLHLDSGPPTTSLLDYMRGEARFRIVEKQNPERFRRLAASAQRDAAARVAVYDQLSRLTIPAHGTPKPAPVVSDKAAKTPPEA
jgi:pyruvate-ferredoxin/flavodoxin oxidoreductase